MNIAELRAELEADQAWRRDEMRFFQNRLSGISDEEERDQYRRALVLLLYAHFEGFCKVALTAYITAVNGLGLTCGEANYAIAAATLHDLFRSLRDPNKKCPEFRRSLPSDFALHRFARDREFVEHSAEFEARRVNVAPDVIETGGNLKPVVLRKLLYHIGLPHDQFEALEGTIQRLLGFRNSIAHGAGKAGVKKRDYEDLRDATYEIMDRITRDIMDAAQKKLYLRVGERAASEGST